jgi:hypothetical protein
MAANIVYVPIKRYFPLHCALLQYGLQPFVTFQIVAFRVMTSRIN